VIRKFESKQEECLVILIEECGELIQEASKMIRKNEYSSVDFIKEVGDVLTMLNLAIEFGMYDETQTAMLISAKRAKLQKWSNLFN
jgi:NTP pyrophosphatase (non-canonical NTP hydrolase)